MIIGNCQELVTWPKGFKKCQKANPGNFLITICDNEIARKGFLFKILTIFGDFGIFSSQKQSGVNDSLKVVPGNSILIICNLGIDRNYFQAVINSCLFLTAIIFLFKMKTKAVPGKFHVTYSDQGIARNSFPIVRTFCHFLGYI